MTEKRDLRIQKTYDSLIDAFKNLLSEKNFEEITVKELCLKAKTRTATFYTHFSDKYEFFYFMVKELRRNFTNEAALDYDKSDATGYYSALLQKGMNFLENNGKMANSIKNDSMLRGICQYMPDEVTEELRERLSRDTNGRFELNYPDVLLQFLIGGLNQVSEWWFSFPRKPDKSIVVADMDIILRALLK